MESIVRPQFYFDDIIFEREKNHFFRAMWQFVGFRSELEEHNDFVCREIGGQSVVVQNFSGELRAFQNVCSHRFSRIQTDCRGNRPLQCPYHGWAYNGEGVPAGIPHRPRFDNIDQDCLQKLRLQQWELSSCGELVFVRQQQDDEDSALTLREFLGESTETIEQMSSSLGPLIDRNEMTIQANWKILVENTLESYHVDFVHANSFKLLGAKGSNFKFDSPHSSWETSIDEKVQRKLKKVLPVFESRPFSIDGYLHQLVFPNLTIATTNGTSFSIQLFDPISPSETAFTSWVFQTKIDAELTAAQGHVVTALNASVKDFNRRVFAEDKEVCEQVQLGTQQTQQTGMLSDEELRVAAFQKEYIARLESVATSDAVEAPTGKLSQPQTSVSRKG